MRRTLIPSDADLRAAWARLGRERAMPSTYEAAMAQPLASRLVRINAIQHLQRGAGARQQQPVPVQRPGAHHHHRHFDPKSLAAGERDDD
ncbi:hypothetical protein [Azohydromonas lata]|uniref:Uncharacterized protein n=1 Tax=Azohydromonas lata TaxID=45677 RepID=A0ABU5ICZ0_9BURK|nr:hypothetical protein [Azohydromonas lata]MDZ5456977.1 hypothetical protein [Azohydromonas lata]